MAIYADERATSLFMTGGEHVAERIVTITRIVENAPTKRRPAVAQLADGQDIVVFLAATSAVGPQPDSHKGQLLQAALAEHFRSNPPRRLNAGYARERPTRQAERFSNSATSDAGYFLASVQLSDGQWLNFSAPLQRTLPVVSMRAALSFAVMLSGILVLAWIVIHHINRPLKVFAAAAARLGTDVNAPPLPMRGPKEVRQATAAFNEMQDRLRRFVQDRTQMLAAIAHDLRTPVTRLRLRAEFTEDPEEQAKTLADLNQMERMITSTLAFARDDAAAEERVEIDLACLLDSVCGDFADVGHKVEWRADEPASFTGRPNALRRALTNLVDNAVKYGEPVAATMAGCDDGYLITIDDNGPGVAEAHLDDVFRPFFRTDTARDDPRGGSGLGLTVARDIVQAHGGRITLINRPEGGLRQDIWLPRGRAPGDGR
ncbi:ATP-binding protein [Ferruginivarius sediminum]|nr:ATP-binding protein [Ferruginivarius sediminum]